MYPFPKVVEAVKAAMSEAKTLTAFRSKEKRNEKTGKSIDQRIIQNCAVLARSKSASADFARGLREAGYRMVFDGRKKECGLFKIGSK